MAAGSTDDECASLKVGCPHALAFELLSNEAAAAADDNENDKEEEDNDEDEEDGGDKDDEDGGEEEKEEEKEEKELDEDHKFDSSSRTKTSTGVRRRGQVANQRRVFAVAQTRAGKRHRLAEFGGQHVTGRVRVERTQEAQQVVLPSGAELRGDLTRDRGTCECVWEESRCFERVGAS
jgi:hypothetical protein